MKKNVCLLISWILSALYVFLLFAFYTGRFSGTTGNLAFTVGLARLLMIPHVIFIFLGFIFNILGWATNSRGFALAGAILYSVGIVFFLPFFFFVIIQMILSYVGFAMMKKPVVLVEYVTANNQ